MKNNTDRISFIQAALKSHNDYWDKHQPIMNKLKNAYMTDFYRGQEQLVGPNELPVESSIAYEHVESVIGSLYTQAPGVEISKDPIDRTGDPDLAEVLVNRFLQRKRPVLEQVSRLALIYPCAFLKLAPRESSDIFERVDIRPIEPWNVIVDTDADCWQNQRYVGHIYWLTIPEAKKRFGAKEFKPCPKKDYFDRTNAWSGDYREHASLPDDFLYIKVVEMYDLTHDNLLFWSPEYMGGEALLDKTSIPIRNFDDVPLPAIVPLYYSADPSRPMVGYSALYRIYDQIKEKNLARSRMASSVRKDARMYIYDTSLVDPNALEKISRGEDGTLIPIEGDIQRAITLLQNPSVNADHSFYMQQIEEDLRRGTIQAPFTRGDATNATATEVNALQVYSASEIGRLARVRDEALESLANIYIRLLCLAVEENEQVVIATDDGPKILTCESLDGKFNIMALDAGNSPVGDLMKQRSLTTLVQPLVFLGANRDELLKELIKVYKLPSAIGIQPEQPMMPQAPQPLQEPAALQPLSETALKQVLPRPPQ